MWRQSLESIISKGSIIRPGSLAGLADARSKHDSQFFTSLNTSELMWQWVAPVMKKSKRMLSLLDSSVGSGRLLHFAQPNKHTLWGIDVDSNCIEQLRIASNQAGFQSEFHNASLVNCEVKNMDIAFINPAFSITVDSPSMVTLPSCTWGTYGKSKRGNLTYYSLEQALLGAEIVVALLPDTALPYVLEQNKTDPLYDRRLAAIVKLPKDAFEEEGIQVSTSLLIFDARSRKSEIHECHSDDPVADLGLTLRQSRGIPAIHQHGVNATEPLITTPVTGDATVRVTHSSRWIQLKFACGQTEALTLNHILKGRLDPEEKVRPANHVKYKGQGILDVESWLAAGKAIKGLEILCNQIVLAGGKPVVDQGLKNYALKRDRQAVIDNTEYRKWVYRASGAANLKTFTAVCHTNYFIDEDDWSFDSEIILSGSEIIFTANADQFEFQYKGQNYWITEEVLGKHFELKDKTNKGGEWVCLFEGRVAKFPQLAKTISKRAEKAGVLDWLSWDYQSHDFIELMMASKGDLNAWEMGLGKTRIALALAMMGGNHNLIVVEPYLIDEMMIELNGLGIQEDLYQVITSIEEAENLKKINFITYNRLRMKLGQHPKLSLAHKLRRRIHTVVADEGSALSNPTSQQTRAMWQLSAKKRYLLDGTPIANYPRNIRPMLNYTAGDSTARNPFGTYHYHMGLNTIKDVSKAGRGVDVFRDQFVTLEWCTNQFADEMTQGAKREVPKVADLTAYRQLLNNKVKRRLQEEPEVKRWVNIKPPSRLKTYLPWDDGHLRHYLQVCDHFAEYFKRVKEKANQSGKQLNLIALLARINAVRIACNQPQRENDFGTWSGITTKQQYIVDKAIENTDQGDKTIIYVENPSTVELITKELHARGYDALGYHGGIPIKQRTKALNERFRFGDCPILVSTIAVSAKGLNLYCANKVIIGSRSWNASSEEQCIYRVCRPQQTRDVLAEYVMIEGSIDVYQDQMVEFKRDAANAGLDYAQPEYDDTEFLHLDTLLGMFVNDIAKLRGYESTSSFKDSLDVA